ncbi:MAG: A24 family peptidase [Terriglobales bacterium]
MVWKALIIAFVMAAAYADVRTRRIPRGLTMTGLVVGLLFHAVRGGFANALLAAGVAFVIGLALFSVGAIGGGDVKLLAALGAMLGLFYWGRAMSIAILVAALMAVIEVIRHGVLMQTLRNMWEICRSLAANRLRPHPVLNVRNAAALRSPFGVAAAVGTIFAIIR